MNRIRTNFKYRPEAYLKYKLTFSDNKGYNFSQKIIDREELGIFLDKINNLFINLTIVVEGWR